jgi:hypothetical protein
MLAVAAATYHASPYDYYKLYDQESSWHLSKGSIPITRDSVSTDAAGWALQIHERKRKRGANRVVKVGNINMGFTEQMHDQADDGLCRSITFLDEADWGF